jgi:hypothetical protein
MPSDLSLQAQQMYSTQPSQQSQLHTKANAVPSLLEFNKIWAKISYNRSRSHNSSNVTKTKYSNENEYWLNQTAKSNRFAVLQGMRKETAENQPYKNAKASSSLCKWRSKHLTTEEQYKIKAPLQSD